MIKQDYRPPEEAPYEVRWIIARQKHMSVLQTCDLEYAKTLCTTPKHYIWDRINEKKIYQGGNKNEHADH